MSLFRCVGCLMLASVIGQAHAGESEIDIGCSLAGQLKAEIEFGQPFELPVSIFPGISGYATGELGIHSTLLDNPTNDFFQFSNSVDLRFILVAKDAGMEVWNDHGSAFMNVGESFFIGDAPFDTHPVWNLTTGAAGNAYSLTLKLHDLKGNYSDSDPFTLGFTGVPLSYEFVLTPVDSQYALLSWPTNAVGWVLQSAGSVTAASWDTITNAPAVSGTKFSLSISTTNSQQFFRLLKQ